MYTLYELGPDNKSTYQECCGPTADSHGRIAATARTLPGLWFAIEGLGHDNFWVSDADGRNVANSRREYREIPEVADCGPARYERFVAARHA